MQAARGQLTVLILTANAGLWSVWAIVCLYEWIMLWCITKVLHFSTLLYIDSCGNYSYCISNIVDIVFRNSCLTQRAMRASENSAVAVAVGAGERALTLQTAGGHIWREVTKEQLLEGDQCPEAISLLKHCTDNKQIFLKMRATFQHRQKLIHNPEKCNTVLQRPGKFTLIMFTMYSLSRTAVQRWKWSPPPTTTIIKYTNTCFLPFKCCKTLTCCLELRLHQNSLRNGEHSWRPK